MKTNQYEICEGETARNRPYGIRIVTEPGESIRPNLDLEMMRVAGYGTQTPRPDGSTEYLYCFRSEKHREEGEKVLAGFCWRKALGTRKETK